MTLLTSNKLWLYTKLLSETEQSEKWLRVLKIEAALLKHTGFKISIRYSDRGKPLCSDGSFISISHKSNRLFVAWSPSVNIYLGCDVEDFNLGTDWSLFDRFFFSNLEVKALILKNPQDQKLAKSALFSAKEAVFKAVGSDMIVRLISKNSRRFVWQVEGASTLQVETYPMCKKLFSVCIGLNRSL